MLTERWQRNLLAIWIAQTLTMISFSFVFPFIPLYIQSLGVNEATEAAQWAGAVGAAAALSMSIVQPIWGNLSDRYGRRPMVIRSMFGGSLTLILMGMARSPMELVILRLIQGTVTGTVAASNTLVATSTPKHRLGYALGLMQMAIFVGNSVGPLVGGLISDHAGYPMAFYTSGVLMLVGGLVVVAFVREDFTPPEKNSVQLGIWAQSRSLLAMPIFPMLLTITFLIQFGGTIITPVLSLFIADLAGGANAASTAGGVLAATGVVSAISALIIGRLSDRIGPTKILPICLAGAMLSYLPQAFVQTVWQLLLLRMLLGVFLGGLMPTANALLARTVRQERRGAAFGLAATANSIANGVGPVSGAVIASVWSMRAVFAATGVLFAVACAWVSFGMLRLQLPETRIGASPAQAHPVKATVDAKGRATVPGSADEMVAGEPLD